VRGTVLYGPRDVRFEELPDPTIIEPTDALIRLPLTCVCGSDLWPYRGIAPIDGPTPMGHEYVGIVEEVGSEVRLIKPGQFVVGSFFASDNTCEICQAGYHSSCIHRQPGAPTGAQAQYARIPLADGTLVATPGMPPEEMIPSLLAASDVLGTGWFGAVAAEAAPGKTVAVVGDGAVGLLAVLAAKQLGADRIIATSRHESRQRLAREFGASEIVTERGEEGAARIKELTGGLGALGRRGGRHAGVDDAGHPLHAGRRSRRLRRCAPRGGDPGGGVLLLACAPARRSRPGEAFPARAYRADLEPED
jgi:threonine dehydrogenase-like Zn-dependent dehydrogenase